MSGLTNPSPATNLKFDASNNVLANIAAQNINPNANALNAYSLSLLSHQTGLSVTATVANTLYNIGATITIPRNGIARIHMAGYVSTGTGNITLLITRGSVTFTYSALVSNTNTAGIQLTTMQILVPQFYATAQGYESNSPVLTIDVLDGDVLQFQAKNGTAAAIVYISDVVVVMQ